MRIVIGLTAMRAAGDPPLGPRCTISPVITGTPAVGETLSLSNGTWSGTGTITYAKSWYRDGVQIGGETGNDYVVAEEDSGTEISGRVAATDDLGTRSRASAPVEVAGGFFNSGYFNADYFGAVTA